MYLHVHTSYDDVQNACIFNLRYLKIFRRILQASVHPCFRAGSGAHQAAYGRRNPRQLHRDRFLERCSTCSQQCSSWNAVAPDLLFTERPVVSAFAKYRTSNLRGALSLLNILMEIVERALAPQQPSTRGDDGCGR